MGQGNDEEVDASPAEIREAIAKARSDLGAHLGALNPLNLLGVGESPGDTEMPTEKRPSPTGSKSAKKSVEHGKSESKAKTDTKKTAAKAKGLRANAKVNPSSKGAKANPSSKGAKARKPPAKSDGVVAKAGAVLDTMAAGAVVGAVKAAAHAIDQNQVQSLKGRGKKSASTSAVLGDLAPEAAMGAVVGAAKSVLPVEENPKGKVPGKDGAKGGAGGKAASSTAAKRKP